MGIDTTILSMIYRMADVVLLGLTPRERLAATGKLSPTNTVADHSGEGTLLITVLVLVLLVLLLWWVSSKRKQRSNKTVQREFFTETANRRGLSTRERQILLAIVVRSGLGQSEDIFTVVDAFDHGAAKLQEECGQTRTADENERLRVEIAAVRSKLGFELNRSQAGSALEKRPRSRDIPVGQVVDLTRRQRDTTSIQAEVVRNDDIELMVELPRELEIHPGDTWWVRFDFGTALWEFDTVVARSEGTRLALNHNNRVRFVNRRRFSRLSVHVPAWVVQLPTTHEPPTSEPPAFIAAVVTEVAGPGLRVEVPVPARVGDRLLVVFHMDASATASGRSLTKNAGPYAVSALGRVQYAKAVPGGVSLVVELSGLTEADVDELVRYAFAVQAHPEADLLQVNPADSAVMVAQTGDQEGAA